MLVFFTFDASFPDCIGIFEARNNVIADLKSELKAITAALLQSKPEAFGIPTFRHWKNNVRPA